MMDHKIMELAEDVTALKVGLASIEEKWTRWLITYSVMANRRRPDDWQLSGRHSVDRRRWSTCAHVRVHRAQYEENQRVRNCPRSGMAGSKCGELFTCRGLSHRFALLGPSLPQDINGLEVGAAHSL